MKRNFEDSKAFLENLISGLRPMGAGNEAATRLHIIDQIFFECLGWEEIECLPEKYTQEGYADYVFVNEYPILVVEAKKEGTYFSIPEELSNRKYKISHFKNSSLFDAINQATKYSVSIGVQIGCVSNGHQFVVFLASRTDGIAPSAGDCLVFRSLDDIEQNFIEFWNLLSYPGITKRNILEILKGEPTRPLPDKLSKTIPGYPSYRTRNEIQSELLILADMFIDGLIGSPEDEIAFLAECYCTNGTLSEYANLSKQIMLSRYPRIFTENVGSMDLRPTTTSSEATRDIVAETIGSEKPIVLLGDVGVGKSIFIKNFINIISEELNERTLYLYIDCGKEPLTEDDLGHYITEKIENILLEKYNIDANSTNFVRGVYHSEAERFSSNIAMAAGESLDGYLFRKTKVKELHIKNVVRHLIHARKNAVVCFIDNLDQRSSKLQEQAYIVAEGLSKDWGMVVFLCLQPQTFNLSKISGILKSYDPRAYTVSPPALEQVLEKRLIYIQKLLRKKGIRLPGGGGSITSEKLLQFFEILDFSVRNNPQLMTLLVNLSGGNIRTALNSIKIFMGSGHVNTMKIFEIDQRELTDKTGRRYMVADHEFLKAILYGEYLHYYPISSPIPNLFDLFLPYGRSHFLMPTILTWLDNWAKKRVQDGFALTSEVYLQFTTWGYAELEIKGALGKLLEKRLIEPNSKIFNIDEIETANYVRITTIGKYCLEEVLPNFAYLEATLVDTPILDDEMRSLISVANYNSLATRCENAKNFLNYLISKAHESNVHLDISALSLKGNKNIERVLRKIPQ